MHWLDYTLSDSKLSSHFVYFKSTSKQVCQVFDKMSRSTMDQQPPPPAFVLHSNNANTYSPHGSIGAVVGVLIMIIILAAIAVVIGRLFSGKTIMGYGHFDLESWAETKCSSCIDGRISVSLPRPNVSTAQQTNQQSEPQTSAPTANA